MSYLTPMIADFVCLNFPGGRPDQTVYIGVVDYFKVP